MEEQNLKNIRQQLSDFDENINLTINSRKIVFEKLILAALGSIPWVGGFISALAGLKGDIRNAEQDNLQTQWLKEHYQKMVNLVSTLEKVVSRINDFGEEISERIESKEYLDLVRKSFRAWDKADTEEKQKYIANLITHSSGTNLCSDDVLRLFIDWLTKYHELHFSVIKHIYQNPTCTRLQIWKSIYQDVPREDSAEADLFRLLIRDLSTGGVIRQNRATNHYGQFVKKKSSYKKNSLTMESAFENTKPYVLTELGKQFVHYTINDIVPRIG